MIRTDLWVAAFVRRHNDIGNICVIARKGDALAGQVFVEVDHLNGTQSLFVPAPSLSLEPGEQDRIFAPLLTRATPEAVRARIASETRFDPDLWVVALETRADEIGLRLVGSR